MWKKMIDGLAEKSSALPVKFVNMFVQIFVAIESMLAGLSRMVADPLKIIKVVVIAIFAYDISIKGAAMTGKLLTKVQTFSIAVATNIAKFGWEMLIFALIIVIILKSDKIKKL